MSNFKGDSPPIQSTYKALGLVVGMVFGGFVGLVVGSPIIFTGGGMILGLALGAAFDSQR